MSSKYKIVRITSREGEISYAIRIDTFFGLFKGKEYVDLESPTRFSWFKDHPRFKHCITKDIKVVEEALRILNTPKYVEEVVDLNQAKTEQLIDP